MYGIAAPYWKETAPTEFRGKGVTPSQEILLRAGMESIAFFVADIFDQLRKIPQLQIHQITAAGGAARRPLLQFQANLLGVPIRHLSITDATALGCAFLTGLQIGFWEDIKEMQNLIEGEETFLPKISSPKRQALLNQWHKLLKDRGIFS
jgi:glycerol kinase